MHGIEKSGRRVTFVVDDWRVTLRPRLGLHQLAEHSFGGVPVAAGRSVWEYAIGLTQGGRKAWAGNWHKWEVQTGLTVNDAEVVRRSLILNPLRAGAPLASSRVVYRPSPEGLQVARSLRWLTGATVGLHYVAMFPLGPQFEIALGGERERGSVALASGQGLVAKMATRGEALLSAPTRSGMVKMYAARSTNDAPEKVSRGDVHEESAVYSLMRQ